MNGIDRRAMLRGAAVGVGTLVAGGLGACSGEQPAPAGSSAPQSEQTTLPEEAATRALIVYFSRPGMNYWHGDRRDLEVGNTQVVAEMITATTGADTFRIEAADPYPHDYDETVERNRREQNDDARPRIAGPLPDLSDYDTVILGCPVWNTRAPMIIRTLLDATDLTGKTIHPFVTYAIGPGTVFDDYETLYPGVSIAAGLATQGEEAADAGAEVEQWITGMGLSTQ